MSRLPPLSGSYPGIRPYNPGLSVSHKASPAKPLVQAYLIAGVSAGTRSDKNHNLYG